MPILTHFGPSTVIVLFLIQALLCTACESNAEKSAGEHLDAASEESAGEHLDAAVDANTPNDDASADDAGTGPTLVAEVRGDEIVVKIESNSAIYWLGPCGNDVRLEKRVDGGWGAPTDERPNQINGHYLDGVYVPPDSSEGCDILDCTTYPEQVVVAPLEFVQTGTQPPPDDVPYSDVAPPENPARVIATRLLRGRVRITVTYSVTEPCHSQDRKTAQVELDIP